MVRLPQLLPKIDDTVRRRVVFVPGQLFFTRTLALPDGMAVADVESFAELTLEEMSPFSLEQLAWGYVTDPSVRWIFIMAVVRPRVPASQLTDWEEALFVLPGYFPLLLSDSNRPDAVLQDHCLTLTHREEGCPLPARFNHYVLPEEEGADPAAAAMAELVKAGGERQSFVELHEAVEKPDGAVAFAMSRHVAGQEDPEALPELCIENMDTLWKADLREPDFKQQERKGRILAAYLWKGMFAAGMLAAVLVVGAVGWLALAGWLSANEQRIARQTPEVLALDLKQKNLEDLKQFAGAPFKPFEVLGALNQVRLERTKGSAVYFISTSVNKDNEVTVRGRAGNIGEVNRYADALAASGLFEQESPPEYQTRGDRTNFTLRLRYVPPAETVPLAEPVEPTPENPTEDAA